MEDPISAAAVANSFLRLQAEEPASFPRIDPMKLQKLLFYAQAWALAITGVPLFVEEIYAWPWGPVVPNIYGTFREFGREPIVGKLATELVRVNPGPRGFAVREPQPPTGQQLELIKSVWDSHKAYSGVQLSNATHAPGEPWSLVKEQFGSLESKPLIPNELIRDVFKARVATA